MLKHKKTITMAFAVIIVAVLVILELFIQINTNKNNSLNVTNMLANQVSGILEDNQISDKMYMNDLKDEFILRAKAVSFMINSLDSNEVNFENLKHISELTSIDEINLFNTDGRIYLSTYPRYIGYSFDSGDQIAYFKPILNNTEISLCQDIVPNTADGKSMMYAMTWSIDKTYLVQIGIEPSRLLKQRKTKDYEQILKNIPLYDGYEIIVFNNTSKQIVATSNPDRMTKSLTEIGLKKYKKSDYFAVDSSTDINYLKYYGYCKVSPNFCVYVFFNTTKLFSGSATTLALVLVYLILGLFILSVLLNKLTKIEDERKSQFSILLSMSEIYYSLHVVDLEKNTVIEYAGHDTVSDEMKKTKGENAELMMQNIMTSTLTEEWLEEGLGFSDLKNVRKMLKGKKIMTKDMVGKPTGWFRMSFITIDAAPDGTPTRIVVTTRIIDEEKRKEQQLYEQSNKDALTQCFNRRAYESYMAEYEHKLAEDNLVIASFDVNSLKYVNDTLGHEAGDELLRGASECILRTFSNYGKIFRTGGDEFVGLLNISEEQLLTLREELNYEIINWKGKILNEISVACGYAHMHENPLVSISELIKIADKRMYEDKSKYYADSTHDRRKRNE